MPGEGDQLLRWRHGVLHGLEPPEELGCRPDWVPIPVEPGQDPVRVAAHWLHQTAGRVLYGGDDALLEGATADERIDAARPYVLLADDLTSGRARLPAPPVTLDPAAAARPPAPPRL